MTVLSQPVCAVTHHGGARSRANNGAETEADSKQHITTSDTKNNVWFLASVWSVLHLNLDSQARRDVVCLLKEHRQDDDAYGEKDTQDRAIRSLLRGVVVILRPEVDVQEKRSDEVGDGQDDEDGPAELEEGCLDQLLCVEQ